MLQQGFHILLGGFHSTSMVLLCACRLEELNEKRQSMVSKLKGVEKELTGTHAHACCTPPHHPGRQDL